jgi:hypothetical protein
MLLGRPTRRNNTHLVAFNPQWNYTDRATAAAGEVSADFSVAWSAQRIHTAVNLGFLDRSRDFFFQAAPHLLSQGLCGPRSRPTASQKI